MITQHDVNQKQYQDKSNAYLTSKVHAQGIEFEKIQKLLQTFHVNRALDLGCGGGHVSYQISPFVNEVVAYDLTPEMVKTVLEEAKQRQLNNIIGVQGKAEQLPFPDESFDVVVSRYSAHHWQNLPQAMAEIFRVLKKGGKAIFIDILGSQQPTLDTFLQTIEMIRDPSHVRDYSLGEWSSLVEQAGFRVAQIDQQTLTLNFSSWVERMQTPEYAIKTIRDLQNNSSDLIKSYYQIQADGTFTSHVLYLVVNKNGEIG